MTMLDYSLFGNPMRDWAISGAVLSARSRCCYIARYALRGRLQRLADASDKRVSQGRDGMW